MVSIAEAEKKARRDDDLDVKEIHSLFNVADQDRSVPKCLIFLVGIKMALVIVVVRWIKLNLPISSDSCV